MILIFIVLAICFFGPLIWGFLADEPAIGFFAGAILAFTVGLVGIDYAHAHYDERVISCTITDKDRGGQDGSYRVYTEECGQLANTDSLWRGKFDSADVWQDVQVSETLDLRVVGWRSEVFSVFPNILKVEQ